jgi:hypothetical protein
MRLLQSHPREYSVDLRHPQTFLPSYIIKVSSQIDIVCNIKYEDHPHSIIVWGSNVENEETGYSYNQNQMPYNFF